MEPFTPVTPPRPTSLATERALFRAFLAARIGSEEKVAGFLSHRLLPALRAGASNDEALITAVFAKAFRQAVNDYIASHLTPVERARAWLACGSASPLEEHHMLHTCVAQVIDTLPPEQAAVLRQIELSGASLWAAGFTLELTANTVWVRLRHGRIECRERLIQFLHDCAVESALAFDSDIAAIA